MNNPLPASFGSRLLKLTSLTIQHITITVFCGLCLLLLTMWCARLSPWFDLSVHFALHALVISVVVIPVLWFTNHRRTTYVCCFVAACFFFIVQPWDLLRRPPLARADSLRVLSWNILAANDDFESVVDLVREVDPDVLVLIEVRPDLIDGAPWIKENYPVNKVIPNWGGAGVAVFCRTDNVEFSVQHFATRVMPSIVATFTSQDGQRHADLIATHTYSPIPPNRAITRNAQLAAFREWSLAQANPQCLVGDLNTTPWSRCFRELEYAGFRDSRQGVGNCASWPSWLGVAGIPIDHALTRGECSVTERRVLSQHGDSDHRPIEFNLSF